MAGQLVSALRDSFSPLRLRNFRIYLGGQAVSLVGTWMQITAQSWVVWEISHSSAALGIVGMFSFLPILLLGPLAGVLADRLDRRRILLLSQTTAMVQAFLLALLVQTGWIQIWHVYVLAALLGLVTALDMPAQQAFIGDLTGIQNIRKAVVLNTMIFQVSRTVGPMLAGVVIASLGTATAFWLNGASFLAVLGSLFVVRAHQVRKAATGTAAGEFVEGLRFMQRQPRMQDLIGFSVLLTFFGISAMTILPAVAAEALRGKADVLGLLMGASGAGSLGGVLFVVPLTQQVRRTGVVIGTAAIWTGIWLALFSFSHSLPFSVLAMFLNGAAFPVVLTTANGLIQFMAPPHMRARVLTAFLMVSFGAQPLAALAVGYSAHALGPLAAVRLNGVLMALGAVALLIFRPELRRWEVAAMPSTAPQTDEHVAMRSEAVQA